MNCDTSLHESQSTPLEQIDHLVDRQREFFATGETLPYEFRRQQLLHFLAAFREWEQPLCDALWTDLHKSREEALLTELSIVEGEIKDHLAHLRRWMKPEHKPTPLKMFPSSSSIVSEPLGNVLIVSPWNYPVQLLLNPLVGALAAGCTAILKPSPYVPHVSKVLAEMINACFDECQVAVVQGHREVNAALLRHRFDMIFFTGSPALGRQVMQAAALHLTPVVLELGGKSPCIVDRGADVRTAARRIAWGKTLNAGQTCIAPDYLLIHASLQDRFIAVFQEEITRMHGADVQQSPHYVRLVHDRAFQRVSSYLQQGRIVAGGHTDAAERYIEPTLLADVSPLAPVMQEEIFGPVLPMIPFEQTDEALRFVREREKPLALYYFGPVAQGREFIRHTSSGGACINDTIMHIANAHLPFGGVGQSGMGHYHGKLSFQAFSHRRALVTTPVWPDLPFRYMPYRLFNWVRHIL